MVNDKALPMAVRQVLEESPVFVDVMYVLGSKAGDVTSFLEPFDPGEIEMVGRLVQR